jgi:pimeloyl-ACP methyl ester carboxylesterase
VTPTPPLPRPLYVQDDPHDVFGLLFQPSASQARRRPVLVCGPFGWEDSAAHRPLREWAGHLAALGHPTLRIDLPGTGDSAGDPFSDDLVEAWTSGLAAAARRLAADTGADRVTVVALGLSGLIAVRAATGEPAIGDLVLWGTPGRGRALVRQLQAFAKMEQASGAVGPDGERVPISEELQQQDDALTTGGFLLTKPTQTALQAVDLRKVELPGDGRRVLLLERDGLPADEPLRARLAEQGVDVTVGLGDGYAQLTEHPQNAVLPTETVAVVDSWLAADPEATVLGSPAVPPTGAPGPDDGEVLLLDGVREEPVVVQAGDARAFGIVAEPRGGIRADLTVLFLNAGAIRRTGPNRMWVEAARRWAAQGIPSIRLDVGAIGDAPRPFRSYVEDGSLHTPETYGDVGAAMDLAVARGLPGRFVLVGLCSGSSIAFNVALRDARVEAAVMLNPRSLVWSSRLIAARDAKVGARVVKGSQWKRVLRGEIDRRRICEIVQAIARYPLGAIERRRVAGQLMSAFRTLDDRDVELTLVFTGNEPLRDELARDGHLGEVPRWKNVAVHDVPGRDHTLRPRQEQEWVHALLDDVLGRKSQRSSTLDE